MIFHQRRLCLKVRKEIGHLGELTDNQRVGLYLNIPDISLLISIPLIQPLNVIRKTLSFNPLSSNPTKWSNTLKEFVGKSRRIVWVFDHFVNLVLKGLNIVTFNPLSINVPFILLPGFYIKGKLVVNRLPS